MAKRRIRQAFRAVRAVGSADENPRRSADSGLLRLRAGMCFFPENGSEKTGKSTKGYSRVTFLFFFVTSCAF